MSYQAFFCPKCGHHLNEVDIDEDQVPPASTELPALAPKRSLENTHVQKTGRGRANCGWCKQGNQTLDHIAVCRKIHRDGVIPAELLARWETKDEEARWGLLRLLGELRSS